MTTAVTTPDELRPTIERLTAENRRLRAEARSAGRKHGFALARDRLSLATIRRILSFDWEPRSYGMIYLESALGTQQGGLLREVSRAIAASGFDQDIYCEELQLGVRAMFGMVRDVIRVDD